MTDITDRTRLRELSVEIAGWWDAGVLVNGRLRAEADAMLAAGRADSHDSVCQAERAATAEIVRLLPKFLDEADAREAEIARLREELAWYGEQARLCRLIHSEGDAGRQALDADGGKRARAALIESARHD